MAAFYAVTLLVAARTDNRMLRALSQVALLLVFGALAPTIVRVVLRTYDAPASVATRITAQCRHHGVRVRGVRLYRGSTSARANALFVGIVPSRRYVAVSETMLENFSGNELDAVMAHEICHGREHHLLWRLVLIATGLVLLNIAGTIGFLYYLVLLVALPALDPYVEMRADDYAARHVSPEAMVAALLQLGRFNTDALDSRRFGYGGHPGLARRIERLGGEVPIADVERQGAMIAAAKAASGKTKRVRVKLPTRWRWTYGVGWTLALATIVIASGDEPSIQYPAFADFCSAVGYPLVTVLPLLAAFGWRRTPLVAVFAAMASLAPSVTDAMHPLPSGRLELTTFMILMVASAATLLDPELSSVVFRTTRKRRARRAPLSPG